MGKQPTTSLNSLGYTIAYHGPEAEGATVYVYDLGKGAITDGPTGADVREAFDQATREVLASEGQLDRAKVELVDRYVTGSPTSGPQYLCAEFMIQLAAGSTHRSYLYLTGVGSKFLKLRVTLPTTSPAVATAREFADAMELVLWPSKFN